MNLNKMYGYFDPNDHNERFNIIGCGAIGSHIAEILIRFGITKINLYDDDVVNEHNLTNQLYTTEDLNLPKTEALKRYLLKINPEAKITIFGRYTNQHLSGHVILAVDSVETRKSILEINKYNEHIKSWSDYRMGLTEAQHFFYTEPEHLLKTLDFTHEEAMQNTPISPCGTTLNVCTTVKSICALGVQNLIHFLLDKDTIHIITINLTDISILKI